MAAGVEMARRLPVPFTFVARAENLIRGRPDLDDTIKRLQAFEKAGADVLYAPGLRDLATMRTVVQAIGKPLNVVMSAADPALTAAEMEAVGVKRLSVGGALSRLALAAFMKGAREMKDKGGFTWMRETMPTAELKKVFRDRLGRRAMLQPGQRRDRLGADLAQQRGEVVVEALAQHQPVLEGEDDDERLHDGAAGGRDAEEGADMPAVPGRLGDVAVVVGPGDDWPGPRFTVTSKVVHHCR